MSNPPLRATLEAVQAGNPQALRPLLEAHPSLVNTPLPHDGRTRRPMPTLLHRAVLAWSEGEPEVPQLLIDHGADVNSTAGGALAPLEMAAASLHPGIAELLIANGADVELHVEVPPVEVAVRYQRRQLFKFLIAAGAIAVSAPWVSEARSEPISKVYRQGNLANTRRHYLVDDRPALRGFFAIGDAHVHTNPIAGRGCALAWVSAFALADALTEHADPDDRAVAFEAAVERDLVPWYKTQVQQDRQAIAVNQALQRGEDPFDFHNADGTVDERKRRGVVFRKGLRHAARSDLDVMRALFRQVNLLDSPSSFIQRVSSGPFLGKILAGYEAAREEELKARPHREEMLELFEAVG